jgi:hypothetical protein
VTLIRLALLTLALAGCIDLGPAGVDCGPVPKSQCEQSAAALQRLAHDQAPQKTIWAIRLRADGLDVIFTDGTRYSGIR